MSSRLHNLPPVYVEETCERRPQPRWLEGFMQVVNETWPHPDHLLINLGRTASNFKTHSMNDCMEALVRGAAGGLGKRGIMSTYRQRALSVATPQPMDYCEAQRRGWGAPPDEPDLLHNLALQHALGARDRDGSCQHATVLHCSSHFSCEDHAPNPCLPALALPAQLPERIDLLIADHLSYPQEGAQPAIYAEALLNRVQLHLSGPLPPTIILNVLPILNHMRYLKELRELFDHRMSCIMNPSICRTTCPTDFVGVPIPEDITSDAESKTAAVARFYGATMFSQAFNLHNMIQDQVHVALNMTECELFGLMYEDSVSP